MAQYNIHTLSNLIVQIFIGAVIGIVISLICGSLVLCADMILQTIQELSYNVQIMDSSINILPLVSVITAGTIVSAIYYLGGIKRWHGPADTILASQKIYCPLDIRNSILSTIAAFVSTSGGGITGLYGPFVHFGGSIGSWAERILKLPINGATMIGCGVAAAISASFHAPIAGVLFAHEAILRHYSLRSMTSIIVASIVARSSTHIFFDIDPLFSTSYTPSQFPSLVPFLLILGPLCGLIAALYMHTLTKVSLIANKIPIHTVIKCIIAAFICGIACTFIPDFSGTGTIIIYQFMSNSINPWMIIIILFFKALISAICIGMGFYGGVFAPALTIGAATGALFTSSVINLGFENIPVSVFPIVSMFAVASSVIGAPLTSVMLVLEFTGSYYHAVAAMVVITLSNLVSNNLYGFSLFDKQLIQRGININLGREHLNLSDITMLSLVSKEYLSIYSLTEKDIIIQKMQQENNTEAYLIDEKGSLLGKINIHDLLGNTGNNAMVQPVNNILVLTQSDNLITAIQKVSNFVGESIPVIDSTSSRKMLGIIAEKDLLQAYLETTETIRKHRS